MKKTAKFHLDKKVISQWESDLRRMTKIYRSIPTDPARTWKYGEMFDNPDYEKNLQAWEEARKLFVRYGRNIHDLVYDEMLPGPEKEKTWQERALREKAWGFLHDIRSSLFDRSYNYLTGKYEPDLPKLGKVRDTNVRRYQKSAREFFEALEDWLALKGGSHVSNRIEQMNLAGFQVRLYDATGSERNIAFVKAGLEKYRERAQAYAPILIQNQVPINIYPNKSHGDAEASYDWGTKTISLWEWATISSRNINRLVWVLAHEMGHHVFKTALNNGQRDLWERVIKGDYKDLDLREVIKKMRPGEDISDFIQRIKNEDPILQLQLETLWHNPSVKDLELFSIRDIVEYLEKGGYPMVRVPATPITQYAAKNPEEAFCEAIGVLVGLGPRGLHEKVRALLRIMIPSIRIATLSSSNFVARFGNVMKNPSRTGSEIRKASNISANIPASTIFDGGWEWDLPGFADWPKFKKLPKEKQIAWAKSFMAAGPKEPVEISVFASGQVNFEDGHHRVMAGKILDLKIPVRVRFINFKPDWWPNLLELLEAGYSPRQYNPQGWNLSRAGVPPLEVVRKGRDAADDWIINEIERKQQEKDDREVRERASQKSASFVSRKSADSRLLSSNGTSLEKHGLGGEKTTAFRGGVLLASDRMASTNEPTDPKLWDKVQALTKGEIKSLRHDGKTIQGPNDGKGFRIFPCVPLDSLALTRKGWKGFKEIQVGEEIVGYCRKTDTLKWTPVLRIHRHEEAPILRLYKAQTCFNFRCTPDHKWVIRNKVITPKGNYSRKNKYPDQLVSAKDIGTNMNLISSARMKGGDDISLHDFHKNNWSWVEKVLQMSEAQREAFFASAIVYDGHQIKYSDRYQRSRYGFSQKCVDHGQATEICAALLGYSVTFREKKSGVDMTSWTFIDRKTQNTQNVIKEHDGFEEVWCPETELGTWLMKQGNMIHVTGNSAYANGWSSKIYKDLGGKWRKSKTARGEAKKDVGQGGLDEWFSGHGGDEGDATWGDWVAITPIKHKVDDKTYEPGDIVGPCGISSDAAWKEITNNGKDPLKCMPRNKAHDMPKENRAELAKEKQKAEEEGSNRGKKPTNTPTFSEEADELLEKSARMKRADSRSDAEKDAIFSKWKDLINMTEKELNSWAKDPNRLEASLSRDEAEDLSKSKKDKIQSGYDSLHRIKRRVSKPQQEWSDEDYDNAAQENGFNQRMIGNKPGDPIGDTGMSKWEISLRNWGHDPSKASSPVHSKWKSWSRKNKLKMASTSRDSMRNSVAGNRSILTTHAGSNMNLSKIAQRVAAKKLENNLSRPVIKKINAAIDKAGLTGRLMFPGSRAGWAKVFEVLGDFGVTTDTIPYISGPSGDIRIFLRWINDEESEIDNTVLVFTWHKQQSEKYEILAYLS